MTFLELSALAVSLSLDVAVVSVGVGSLNRLRIWGALLIALIFTVFHAGLLLVGAYAGDAFIGQAEYGRFIGFALLMVVGGKMLFEARSGENIERERDALRPLTLLMLAFAISIDAFAVGISLAVVGQPAGQAAAILAAVTLIFSLAGLYAGNRSKHLLGTKIELIGAAVLIILAFKVLLG